MEQPMTSYFLLDGESQLDVLKQVRRLIKKPLPVIEKDIWLMEVMSHLFTFPGSDCFNFGGGTSLAKAFNLINRFSEDIDIVYDVRKLVPDDVAAHDLIPGNRSGADRRTKNVRHALNAKLDSEIFPYFMEKLGGLKGVSIASEKREGSDKQPKDIIFRYPSVIPAIESQGAYIANEIRVEFRGTATGEPSGPVKIHCYCDGLVEGVSFPEVTVKAIDRRKTFLDKIMHIYSECLMEGISRTKAGGRNSRHWFDVAQMGELMDSPDMASFISTYLPSSLEYQNMFFPKFIKNAKGVKEEVNLQGLLEGDLRLIPSSGSPLFSILRTDYQEMLDSGMIYGDNSPSFDDILEKCQAISGKYSAIPIDSKAVSKSAKFRVTETS